VDDADLTHAGWRSLVAFQRLFGLHPPDAELLEPDGYVASRVPASHASIVNAVVPTGPIAPHLDDIERFYSGQPKWGVWIDPAATDDVQALRERGLVLDSTPVLMAAEISQTERGHDRQAGHVSLDEAGMVNDAAYDLPADTIGGPLSSFPSTDIHAYGIRELKEAMSVALVLDVADDALVTFVATLPANRGERLASRVVAHALYEAGQRGARTTSLAASKLGQNLYARLGYRPLNEIHLYEKRLA
jgi:GNAT superfamily N-acetyltransferase